MRKGPRLLQDSHSALITFGQSAHDVERLASLTDAVDLFALARRECCCWGFMTLSKPTFIFLGRQLRHANSFELWVCAFLRFAGCVFLGTSYS
jgi:hypothetical protein